MPVFFTDRDCALFLYGAVMASAESPGKQRVLDIAARHLWPDDAKTAAERPTIGEVH